MESIKEILEKAYGKALVKDDKFKICEDGEEIFYWTDMCNIQKKDIQGGQYYITSQQTPRLEKLGKLIQCTKEQKKGFLFYTLEGFDNVIFSIEIESYTEGHVQFQKVQTIKDGLKKTKDGIVRFNPQDGRDNKVYLIAIKIGPEDSRDYTALKNYIVSSDNRTYNKVVRNMIEYIEVEKKEISKNASEQPYNLLVSGAPGTGKSHFLDKQVKVAGKNIIENIIKNMEKDDSSSNSSEVKDIDEVKAIAEKQYCDKYVTRVTFYEDYSYENFVGCYKPIPDSSIAKINYNGHNGEITENKITYKYVSGPFIDTYIKAKNDSEHSYYLIIEEINRAKAASVFGDIFQLLDRKNGISEYEIKPDASLNDYLKEKVQNYSGFLKLPNNMYIWATMNSADQGVLPLDSAFKRRWSSLYMDINGTRGGGCSYKLDLMKEKDKIGTILWENLRCQINRIILDNGFDEDRCIGPWYFSEAEIAQISNYFHKEKKDRNNTVNPLVDKLLFYLRQDVFRRNPSTIFNDKEEGKITMSDIRKRVHDGDEGIEELLRFSKPLSWEKEENSINETPN